MGRASRDKGSRGELEVCKIAKEYGFPARRTAPMQAARGGAEHFADVDLGLPDIYLEVKRRERLEVPVWCMEAELSARPNQVAVVAWRRSQQPWRVSLPMGDFLALLRAASPDQQALEDRLREME